MKPIRFLIAFLIILTMGAGAFAEEKRWTEEAELSYVDTGGNTDVTTLSAKNLLKYKFTKKLEGVWKLGALYGKSDGDKNAENYFTELRMDYLFTTRFYCNVLGGWMKDKFAGFDSRYYAGPGMGYKFLMGPKHTLLGEVGLRYVNEEYTNDTDKDYLEGLAFAKYEYAFTNKNKFSQSLEFLYDFEDGDNYRLYSETALLSSLSDYFSLKTSYVIKYDNEPVPKTLDDTDTILALALVVNF